MPMLGYIKNFNPVTARDFRLSGIIGMDTPNK